MKTSLDNHDNKSLFDSICAVLTQRFGQLPSYGVLTGQSVASACLSALGMGNGPMRDLDLFLHVEPNAVAPENGFNYNNPPLRSAGEAPAMVMDTPSYSDTLQFGTFVKKGYELVYSCTPANQPELNIVGYRRYDYPQIKDTASDATCVILGFDINICQIALDMDEEKVYWTADFQRALTDQVLRIVNLSTPIHSAFRLLKKAGELPSFSLDLNHELGVLQQARALAALSERDQDTPNRYLRGHLMAPATLEKYREYLPVIAPYFSLRTVNITLPYVVDDIVPEDGNIVINPVYGSLAPENQLVDLRMNHDMRLYDAMSDNSLYCMTKTQQFYTLDSKPLSGEKQHAVNHIKHSRIMQSVNGCYEEQYYASSTLLMALLNTQAPSLMARKDRKAVKAYLNQLLTQYHADPQLRANDRLDLDDVIIVIKDMIGFDVEHARGMTPDDVDNILFLLNDRPALFNHLVSKNRSRLLPRLKLAATHCLALTERDMPYVIRLYEVGSHLLTMFNFPALDDHDFMSRIFPCVEALKQDLTGKRFTPVSQFVGLTDQIAASLPDGATINTLSTRWDFLTTPYYNSYRFRDAFSEACEHNLVALQIALPDGSGATVEFRVHVLFDNDTKGKLTPVHILDGTLTLTMNHCYNLVDSHSEGLISQACGKGFHYPVNGLPDELLAMLRQPEVFNRLAINKADLPSYSEEIPF